MKTEVTYSSEEVKSNINKLNSKLDQMKSERTDLSKSINEVKKQIIYWEEFDISQIKLF